MALRRTNAYNSVGRYLADNVLLPLEMSVTELADGICVPANRLYQIMKGDRELTTDTAVRLGHYFGTGPEMWLYLQMQADLKRYEDLAAHILPDITPYGVAGSSNDAITP